MAASNSSLLIIATASAGKLFTGAEAALVIPILSITADLKDCNAILLIQRNDPFIKNFSSSASSVDENAFYKWAKSEKMDETKLKDCVLNGKYKGLVDQHLKYSKQFGVLANPTLWIDGRLYEGVISASMLSAIIESEKVEKHSTWFAANWRRIKGFFRSL